MSRGASGDRIHCGESVFDGAGLAGAGTGGGSGLFENVVDAVAALLAGGIAES